LRVTKDTQSVKISPAIQKIVVGIPVWMQQIHGDHGNLLVKKAKLLRSLM